MKAGQRTPPEGLFKKKTCTDINILTQAKTGLEWATAGSPGFELRDGKHFPAFWVRSPSPGARQALTTSRRDAGATYLRCRVLSLELRAECSGTGAKNRVIGPIGVKKPLTANGTEKSREGPEKGELVVLNASYRSGSYESLAKS